MNNNQFLQSIAKSFKKFLETSARSNEKLKILHGDIAKDLIKKLGKDFEIKSLGVGECKEGKLAGKYMEKVVDILISKNKKNIAGVGVKFVMNNYSQNSNNYFENMLGETANIRSNKKNYFQIIILPEEMPYYDKNGEITSWEKTTIHNLDKYNVLSHDNINTYLHTPTKTLLFVVKFPKCDHKKINNKDEYKKYYLSLNNIKIKASKSISKKFGEVIVFNNYEEFIKKVVYFLKSI